MKIRLYQCKCRVNDVNKLGSSQTKLVKEVEAEVYGDFYMSNASFKLSDRWASNYCSWHDDKLGITFCGWTTVSTNANGLFTYHIQEDILEMAWLDGCFNTNAMCVYSEKGSKYLYDSRLATETQVKRIEKSRGVPYTPWVAMNVLTLPAHCAVSGADHETLICNPDTLGLLPAASTSPTMVTYVMPYSTFSEFACWTTNTLTDKQQAQYLPSIRSIYVIDSRDFDQNRLISTSKIMLIHYNRSAKSSDEQFKISGIEWTGAAIMKFDKAEQMPDDRDDFLYKSDTNKITGINFELSHDRIPATLNFKMRNGGEFNITPKDVMVNTEHTINSIGYATCINPSGMNIRYYLTINDRVYKDIHVDVGMQNILELPVDTSVNTAEGYKQLTRNNVTQGITTALAIVGTTVAIAAAPVTSGLIGGLAVMGVAGSGFNTLLGGVSNVASNESQRNALQQQAAVGGYSTVGGQGWAQSRSEAQVDMVTIYYREQIDRENFQALYSLPDYHMRNLSTLKGYVQTVNVRLVSKTGNMSIGVRAVDEALNGSGVFIL